MRFNRLDLNLLVALNALLTERSITKAAARLHLTQSATSNALSRLREYFDDELLVAVGRSLEPTPRARALESAVREVLMRIDTTITASPDFDPSCSDREFTLFISDFCISLLLPEMNLMTTSQRSRVRLRLNPHLGDATKAVERGEVDLLVTPGPFCSREHPVHDLFDMEYVCLTWRDSEIARLPLTCETFREARHAVLRLSDVGIPNAFENWFAHRHGVACRIGSTTYSLTTLPMLVIGTEMIATVPRLQAQRLPPDLPLQVRPMPDASFRLMLSMQWHQQRSDDPGLRWLRELVAAASARVCAAPPGSV